jgi:carbon starvation protein
MLQDLGKHLWAPFGRVSWYPAVLLSSGLFVGCWGYFLYQGVTDPLGGINSLWPLFGIANQLLATVALCVGTTIIISMGKARYAWITLTPMLWLVIVTMTAGWMKLHDLNPKIGFIAHATWVQGFLDAGGLPPGVASVAAAERLIFNDRLDAAVAAFFMVAVLVILADSARTWWSVLSGRTPRRSTETPPIIRGTLRPDPSVSSLD